MRFITTLFLFGVTLFTACDDGGDSGLADGPGAYKADYRTSSAFFTQMAGRVLGNSPHGTSQIWYSSNIKSLVANTSFDVPVGTTAIKEFDMDGDGNLDGLAVMFKKDAGFDPTHGDWHYEMRGTSGDLMPDPAPGAIPMCVGCHTASAGTDYLAGTELR